MFCVWAYFSFCYEYLSNWSNNTHWIPYDFQPIAKMVLTSEFLQWKMWLSEKAHEKVRNLGQRGNVTAVTYDTLTGTGAWTTSNHQTRNIPPAALPHVLEVALQPGKKLIRVPMILPVTKIQKGPKEPHVDFIGGLKESLEKQVREQIQEILLRQLAYDHVNEDCQALM